MAALATAQNNTVETRQDYINRLEQARCHTAHNVSRVPPLSDRFLFGALIEASAAAFSPTLDSFTANKKLLDNVLKHVFGLSTDISTIDAFVAQFDDQTPVGAYYAFAIVFGLLGLAGACVIGVCWFLSRNKKDTPQTPFPAGGASMSLAVLQPVSIPPTPRNFSKKIKAIRLTVAILFVVLMLTVLLSLIFFGAYFVVTVKLDESFDGDIRTETENLQNEMMEVVCVAKTAIEQPGANKFDEIKPLFEAERAKVERFYLTMIPAHQINALYNHFTAIGDHRPIASTFAAVPATLNQEIAPVVDKLKPIFNNFAEVQNMQQDDFIATKLKQYAGIVKPFISAETLQAKSKLITDWMYNEMYTTHKEFEKINTEKPENDIPILILCALCFLLLIVSLGVMVICYIFTKHREIFIVSSAVSMIFIALPAYTTTSILVHAGSPSLGCAYIANEILDFQRSLNTVNNFFGRNSIDLSTCVNNTYPFKLKLDDLIKKEITVKLDAASIVFARMANEVAKKMSLEFEPLEKYYREYDAKFIKLPVTSCPQEAANYNAIACFSKSLQQLNQVPNLRERVEETADLIAAVKGTYNAAKNLKIFDTVQATLANYKLDTTYPRLNGKIKEIKTTFAAATPQKCDLLVIYNNLVARICDPVKPLYMLTLSQILMTVSFCFLAAIHALISYLRKICPSKTGRSTNTKSKRTLITDNQCKFGNLFGVNLDTIGNDPRRIYEAFERNHPRLTADAEQKPNAYPNAECLKYQEERKSATARNRISDLPVLDQSMVDLGYPGGDNYFNANWVLPSGAANKYMVAQAPVAHTAVDLWHAVFLYKCKAIVMLCDFRENEGGQTVEKCHEYWHETGTMTFKNQHETYKVKCVSNKQCSIGDTKHLVFSVANAYTEHTVDVIQYTGWTDDRLAPENPLYMAQILNLLYTDLGDVDDPVLVHCVDGISRSAAFVGTDMLLSLVDENPNPNPTALLQKMRSARANCFTNKWQFYFTFSCFFEFHILNGTYGQYSKIYNFLVDRRASFVDRMKDAKMSEDTEGLKQRRKKIDESIRRFNEMAPVKEKKGTKSKDSKDSKESKEKEKEEERNLTGKTLAGLLHQYSVGKLLGAGTYGQVYLVTQTDSKAQFALKTENKGIPAASLLTETAIMCDCTANAMENRNQIVAAIDKGQSTDYGFLVMTLVGKCLTSIQKMLGSHLNTFSAMYLSVQTFNAIHQLHFCGYIHRDIKPGNFAIGPKKQEKVVFILDFGMSRRCYDENGKVIERKGKERGFVGTLRYAPRAAHELREQHPWDDVESWLFMSIEFFQKLEWKGKLDRKFVLNGKKTIIELQNWPTLEQNGLPGVYKQLIKMIAACTVTDTPDYMKMMRIMMGMNVSVQDDLEWLNTDNEENPVANDNNPTSRDNKANVSVMMSQRQP